jgi:hypothetical protein
MMPVASFAFPLPRNTLVDETLTIDAPAAFLARLRRGKALRQAFHDAGKEAFENSHGVPSPHLQLQTVDDLGFPDFRIDRPYCLQRRNRSQRGTGHDVVGPDNFDGSNDQDHFGTRRTGPGLDRPASRRKPSELSAARRADNPLLAAPEYLMIHADHDSR